MLGGKWPYFFVNFPFRAEKFDFLSDWGGFSTQNFELNPMVIFIFGLDKNFDSKIAIYYLVFLKNNGRNFAIFYQKYQAVNRNFWVEIFVQSKNEYYHRIQLEILRRKTTLIAQKVKFFSSK